MPAAVYEGAGAAIGTNTYVVGGGDPALAPGSVKAQGKASKVRTRSITRPDTSFNTTYVYDTVADSWDTGPNTNVAHSFTGGTAVGNKLLVMCGFDGVTGDTNIVEESICGTRNTNADTDSNAYTDAQRKLSAGNYRVHKPGDRGWQLSGVQQRGWHYREPLLARL